MDLRMQNTINNNRPTDVDPRITAINALLASARAAPVVPPMPVNTVPLAAPVNYLPPMPVYTALDRDGRTVIRTRGSYRTVSRSRSRVRILPTGEVMRNRSPTSSRTGFPYPVPNLNDIYSDESDEDITTT